ncbi:MAG: NosD domain-containing protein, partial [Promethearchaeota archaeon]
TGGGILIENSREYFIIRHCWFSQSGSGELDAGMYIMKSGNGTITDNIFINMRRSILIEFSCDNINITNNYMVGGGFKLYSDCDNILFEGNKVIDCYYPIHISKIENTTIKSNYISNNVSEDIQAFKVPIKLVEVNYSKVIYNSFDGQYSKLKSFVSIVGGSNNNIIKNNTQVVNKTASPSTSVCIPKLSSSTDTSLLTLENCYNNLIAHNRVYISRSDGGTIPGYDIFLILGAFCIISAIIAKKVIKK